MAAEPASILPAGTTLQPLQPQAAIAEDGTVWVVFGSGDDLYCTISLDGAETFGAPVRIGTVPNLMLGKRRGPRIAAGADLAVVTAIGTEGNILVWRSTDRGNGWAGPVVVNDRPTAAREGLHALARGPEGELYCAWLDLRNGKTEIYGAASHDGGRSWSENRRVYRSPDGSVCECCHPSAAFDSDGGLHVMWRNSLAGRRDMYLASSTDGGRSFGAAVKLGRGSWPLEHCPMDGGMLAPLGPGKVASVWRRDKEIFLSGPEQSAERRLGRGEQPWIAATDRGPALVWIEGRPGHLWVMKPGSREPVKLSSDASDPVIAAPRSGPGPAVIVWEQGRGKGRTIVAQNVSAE